ncbi:4-phosphoerythronate dehydrogenase [Aliidiomarina sp. Khilg15.8]
MQFLIADNIPLAREVFTTQGTVERFSGRTPAPEQLHAADVLLVRSITQVNAELLEQAPRLKFVGTATIGCEHVDEDALAARGIGFASSPGANADSVGEYVFTAVLALAQKKSWTLAKRSAAIVGAGATGRAAGRRLSALGIQVEYYDPPRQAESCRDFDYITWEQVLGADIISLHVPLLRQGPHATYHLFDEAALARLQAEQLLINSSRGAVVDNAALGRRLQNHGPVTVLDVWEGEPQIDVALLDYIEIATPHIAGHSLNGKFRGTQMLYEACRKFFAWSSPEPDWEGLFPAPTQLGWECTGMPTQKQLTQWSLDNYPIWQDDQAMRQRGTSGAGFDELRRNYPVRYELCSQIVEVPASLKKTDQDRMQAMGFNLHINY